MFKNTNEFFEEVAEGKVANIDMKRYVNSITENHKIGYLRTLAYDISFFLSIYREDLLAEITENDWEEKIDYYKQRGEKIPVLRNDNFQRKLNKTKGLPFDHLPEFVESYDLEKIFFPYELFSIVQLENYINDLICLKENIFTFSQDFINSYSKNLKLHFEEFKSNDELDYIEYELERYKRGIESINYDYIETNPKLKFSQWRKETEQFGMFEKKNLHNTFQRQNNGRINNEDFKHKLKENLEIVLIAFYEILTFLEQQKINIETPILTPKHENIFYNNGFVLFEHILNEYVKTKRGRLSDIHFFYWSMFDNKPQFIHQRPERFKEWFFENYKEDLGKIKTYNEVDNPDRQKHYSNALDWFKLQN
jgi:hypothetical protein